MKSIMMHHFKWNFPNVVWISSTVTSFTIKYLMLINQNVNASVRIVLMIIVTPLFIMPTSIFHTYTKISHKGWISLFFKLLYHLVLASQGYGYVLQSELKGWWWWRCKHYPLYILLLTMSIHPSILYMRCKISSSALSSPQRSST